MLVYVEMVEVALLDAPESRDLREHRLREPEAAAKREPSQHLVSGHDPPQLGENPLSRRLGHSRSSRAGEPLGLLVRRERELGGQAREPEGSQRVRFVRARAEHPEHARREIVTPAVRVDDLVPAEEGGHRVDGEVALGQVGLDRASLQRRDVAYELALTVDRPPRAEPVRQPEDRATDGGRHRTRHPFRVARDREVDVRDAPFQHPVAKRSSHDPRRLRAQRRSADRGDGRLGQETLGEAAHGAP